MMHIIIAGSRNFNDYSVVEKEMMNYIGKFIGKLEIEIISGGATGVDALGERFAHEHNLPLRIVPADWKRMGDRLVRGEMSKWLVWLALWLPFGTESRVAQKT